MRARSICPARCGCGSRRRRKARCWRRSRRLLDNAVQARSRYVQSGRPRLAALCAGGACRRAADHARLGRCSARAGTMPSSPAIAVLIITCPCALGLAIPAVQTVVSGAMFRAGVLLNSGDAIERLAEVDHVVFDKTGTLTLPDLDVTNAADIPARRVRTGRPAGLGQPSSGRRRGGAGLRRKGAAGRGSWRSPGRACAAWSTGARFGWAGHRSATRSEIANEILWRGSGSLRRRLPTWGNATRLCGAAAPAVRCRRRRSRTFMRAGIEVEILSGDREPAVRHAAAQLGIREWRAGVTPADKIARIEELKRQGVKVLMVGDGMNDAPALAAAACLDVAGQRHASEPGHRRSGVSRRPPRAGRRRPSAFRARRCG